MPELSTVERIVLDAMERAGGKTHVSKLFESIRTKYVPFTDTEIVSAIWSLKDRRKLTVMATGELELVREPYRARRAAMAV